MNGVWLEVQFALQIVALSHIRQPLAFASAFKDPWPTFNAID